MSSAYYPMGMRVNNYPGQYISWKSPVNYEIVPRNIKPFTNKDSLNFYNSVSRKPRPIKHYRKGIFVNIDNGTACIEKALLFLFTTTALKNETI